jgi:glycosyltransferase involved in cell wall biosynthesis
MSETFESSSNPMRMLVKRWRVRRFERALVGGRVHADYLTRLGYPRDRVEIGYDVVDNRHFARAMAPYGVAMEKRYFFANTRFLARKGVDALLRAYARYRALETGRSGQPAPWDLVVSGSGPMERAWKGLARDFGVDNAVRWPGFLQYGELPAAYRSAGAFVHPARREAWGLVVNEAAAAGLPLIVGRRVGAACELVRDGENGFLVDPDDTEAFAAVLSRVARMGDAARRRMGDASRRIVAGFGPERFGQALVRCLAAES